MAVNTMHRDGRVPYEGQIVECRWGTGCGVTGYAIYRAGVWEFKDELKDKIEFLASPEQRTARAARAQRILGERFDEVAFKKAQEDIE